MQLFMSYIIFYRQREESPETIPEDTYATIISPSINNNNNNNLNEYSYANQVKMSNIMQQQQLEQQSDYAYANTVDLVRANEQQYANVGSGGNGIETDPDDGVQVYAEVNKPHKSGPVLAKPVDIEGEYAEYGPAPTVPDKKF